MKNHSRFDAIQILGLFGVSDLELSVEESWGLIIGYGFNGCGKTTMFKILEKLFCLDFLPLSEVEFGSIILEGKNQGQDFHLTIEKSYQDDTVEGIRFIFKDEEPIIFHLKAIRAASPYYLSFGEKRYLPQQTHKPESSVIPFLASRFGVSKQRLRKVPSSSIHFLSEWLNIRNKLAHSSQIGSKEWEHISQQRRVLEFLLQINVEFIEDSRLDLLQEGENKISQLETDILKRIRKPARNFRQKTENLSSTLLERVLAYDVEGDGENIIRAEWKEFVAKYAQLYPEIKAIDAEDKALILEKSQEIARSYVNKLNNIGLSSYQNIKYSIDPSKPFHIQNKTLLSLLIFRYSLDLLEALAIFVRERILSRAEMFVSMFQDKLPEDAHLRLEPDRIFIELSYSDKELSIQKLSSGQKHLLTLFYYLCWEIEEHSILLIDEPEISLNIEWQKQLPNDLLAISAEHNVQFILATHSPYMFGDYFETNGVEFMATRRKRVEENQ